MAQPAMTQLTHKDRSAAETVPEYLSRIGTKGGASTSETKRNASAANLATARQKRWPKQRKQLKKGAAK